MLSSAAKLCFAVATLAAAAAAEAGAAAHGGVKLQSAGVPAGFAELTRARDTVADVYFGGRKVGEARVSARPGFVRLHEPAKVLALLPNVIPSAEVTAALSSELPANASLVCPEGVTVDCGLLSPGVAGVIFDEDRFRLDIFINPKWLELVGPDADQFLPTPTAPLSLTSSMGLALSGSSTTSTLYNFQNRSVVSYRNARLRTESAYASSQGLLVDTFVAELDRRDLRYSAGIFWAPGIDLIGRRRILGVGVGTQFDTRANREQLQGTPLIVFLAQPARIDVIADGRLVTSGLYEPGNNLIDTSSMPDGSYSVTLRIHERTGNVREERRFFAKSAQVAPAGQPLYFGYAGVLANSHRGRLLSLSRDFYYQFGTARRLSEAIAIDASVLGTGRRPLVEIGAWFLNDFARIRAAGLLSPRGDRGALVQVVAAQVGPLTLNFDLRRIWSRNNAPLLPTSNYVETFDSTPLTDAQKGSGSFTQASGSIGYRIGKAYLAIIGTLRKDKGLPTDFSVGPNLSWPLLNNNGLQVALQADAQLTRTTMAGFVGFRMLFTSGRYSVVSTAGRRGTSARSESEQSRWRAVASTQAQYSYQHDEQTDLSVSAGLERDVRSTTARATGLLYSRFGSLRGEIASDFEGEKRTQYSLSIQSGAALNNQSALIGGRNLDESALVVSVTGSAVGSEFEVLIDGQPRGRLSTGGRLPIFLRPYRSYNVRLRPADAAAVWLQSSAREITLFPGNVQHARWQAERLITVFGRVVHPDGTPVAGAVVTGRRGVGQSDAKGYFQIDVSGEETLSFLKGEREVCSITVPRLDPSKDYAALGRLICR